jgi:hypothetical protein
MKAAPGNQGGFFYDRSSRGDAKCHVDPLDLAWKLAVIEVQ